MVFGFGKKKEPELPPIELPPSPPTQPKPNESVTMESLKMKMDLLALHMESLKAQYSAINERLENLEKMVKEIYALAKS
jgi:hypothetical protein